MPQPSRFSVDRSWYRWALLCCPPSFRREYAGEMLLDFEAARDDAKASGRRRDLWRWRLAMAIDSVRTVGTQWIRTGLPAIAIAAPVVPLLLVAGVATVMRRLRFDFPSGTANAESIGLVIAATVVVLVVAMTILFTLWIGLPARHRSRSRRCSRHGA